MIIVIAIIVIVVIINVLAVVLSLLKKNDTVATSDNGFTGNMESMDYVDDGSFSMVIADVFTIVGRGTAVTGHIDSGMVKVNDIVKIDGVRTTTVVGIEMFRKKLEYAKAGDNVGLLLKDIDRKEITQGQIITK